MKEIVRIGYERIDFYAWYQKITFVFNDWYNIDFEKEKETIKEEIKNFLSYYYLKDALFNAPISRLNMIYSIDAKQAQYRIVTIPKKELEMILLKNKLGGYLTFTNMVSEQEFDKTFEELYQELIEKAKQVESVSF